MTCMARPPAVAPPHIDSRLERVCIRHPGYGDDPNNILLNLPAVDGGSNSSSSSSRGLHHRTALTAAGILANNAFDQVYFAHDQAGTQRVETALDGILLPGNYWLHLGRAEEETTTVPPAPLRTPLADYTSTSMAPPPRSGSPSPPELYPIVPSFQDWRFPHGRLPPEWTSVHQPPPPELAIAPAPPDPPAGQSCCVSALRTGLQRCHLVPQASLRKDWFISNAMAQYADDPRRGIQDTANLATMRSDIHFLFDSHRFVVVPKPSARSHPDSTSFALAVHVLQEGLDDIIPLHHNVSIQPSSAATLGREFLFARFALSVFTLIQSFVDSPAPRYLSLSKLEESMTKLEWMNGQQFAKHRDQRDESRNESKKRSSSQISRDHPADAIVPEAEDVDDRDARRTRRGCRLDCTTEDVEAQDWDRCTSWPDERCRSDSLEDDRTEQHRGRSRTRAAYVDTDILAMPDPEVMPNLSRSFTTGSTRSSVFLDPLEDTTSSIEGVTDRNGVTNEDSDDKVSSGLDGSHPRLDLDGTMPPVV